MPHTSSRFMADLGFSDGLLILSNPTATGGTSAPTGATRNGVGDFSWNFGASLGPITFSFNLANAQLYRSGFFQDTQNAFGSTFGSGLGGFQAGSGSAGTGIPADAEIPGRPDTFGAMSGVQQLLPRTAFIPKGFQINSINVIYLVTGAALTGHTCRLDKSVFANNVALASTNVLTSGANGLATATQANPYCTEIAMPAAFQAYQVSDLSEYWFEVSATTQAAGAYRLYGLRAKVTFNFN